MSENFSKTFDPTYGSIPIPINEVIQKDINLSTIVAPDPFYIGGAREGGNYFTDGRIHAGRVWDEVITPTQIYNNYYGSNLQETPWV